MKTPEELKALKEEVETLNKKLAELSEEELKQVSGGKEGEDDFVTKMVCPCGYVAHWRGNFVGAVFDCRGCRNHTLKGVGRV